MVDLNELENKLGSLTGFDFESAERNCRKAGDITPDITFSKNFAVALAAKALSCPVEQIKNLGLKEYVQVTTMVNNFLFSNLVEERDQATVTEK